MKTKILKAIMGRYGSLSNLYESMREDEDVVLINLNSDVNNEFTELEILDEITNTI